MFGLFKRKKSAIEDHSLPLKFKSGNEAFEYACKYLECPLHENAMLPALVVDASKEFGTRTAIKLEDDGTQVATLRVASKDGGFIVMAKTVSADGPILRTGQLVGWQAIKYMKELGEQTDDNRFGWVGLIIGTLKPEYQNGSWAGDERFHP